MGTNYELRLAHGGETLHIGKSSAGWAFALRVDPDRGINGLEDWERLWSSPGARIFDEYGRELSPREMRDQIVNRGHPMGLRRTGGICGPGTWDLVEGEFS